MGLFNKLKNILFEEEVVEIPVEEPKKKIEQAPKIEKKPVKMTFESKEEESIVSDRELFKAEKTFDFPAFDDHEFDSMKEMEREEKPEKKEPESMSINLFDYEKPKIKKRENKEKKAEEIKGRAYQQTKKNEINSKFKPSPVISPVYGVLDKNYTKDDIVPAQEIKKAIDVDTVRKKAFGTLEEDLEKTLSKPIKKFYENKEELPKTKKKEEEKEEKTIEDLLEETAFDVIDLPSNNTNEEYDEKENYNEEEIPVSLDQLDKKRKKIVEEDEDEEDNSNLFDLIDSMYDKKEEK